MKRWIAMMGMAAALGTGGALLSALPAGAAGDPPVAGTCPPLVVAESAGIEHIADVAVDNILVACKHIGG
jgi:hypothetical protein